MFPSLSYCVPFNKLSSFHSPSNFTPSEKVYHNLRLAGNDHFAIKKISGHKTDSAFQRYNLVTEEEMKGMKWLEEKGANLGMMDTYMDTK